MIEKYEKIFIKKKGMKFLDHFITKDKCALQHKPVF